MLTKFFLFYILMLLLGNPFLAILVLVGLYLAADVRYVGWTRKMIDTVRTEREIGELSRQVALNPYNASAQNDLGRLLVLRGRFRDALTPLEKAIERMEDSPETNYYLGLACLHSGREEEGEARIVRALELNPRFRYGEPNFRLGAFLLNKGRIDEARGALEKGVAIHTSSAEGWYLLGQTLRAGGDKEKAKDYYKKAIESFRNSPGYKRREDRRFAWRARMALRGL
jgi:tetratricopeptide (TPR) repeat protein